MTEQEQQITIAMAHGWTAENIAAWKEVQTLLKEYRELRKRESFSGWNIVDKIEAVKNQQTYIGDVPNYPQDLNACHEVEKRIKEDDSLWDTYGRILIEVVMGKQWWEKPLESSDFATVSHANAEQRSEAICRLIKETKCDLS